MQTMVQSRLTEELLQAREGSSSKSWNNSCTEVNSRKRSQSSAIAECPQGSKPQTSQDKSLSCDRTSQMQTSSPMSEADSTSRDKDCGPFYDALCKEISSRLLSHTEIDSADSDSSSSNSSCKTMEAKSWFSTMMRLHQKENSPKTSLPLCTSSRAECTDSDATQLKSRKIRIYPTQQQKLLFKQWFGVSRRTYNDTVSYFGGDKQYGTGWMGIAKHIMGAHDEDWYKCVPYQVKKIAVKDCTVSYANGMRKLKKEGKAFKLHFRSKRDTTQSCFIPKDALTEQGIYHTIAGKLKFTEREHLKGEHGDCRLLREYGRWYVLVPLTTTVTASAADNQGTVALDPGVRTFITYFSDDGRFGQLGHGCVERLIRLEHKIDSLKSLRDTTKDKHKKGNLSRSLNKARARISDLVSELHWKCALYLASSYGTVYLPTYETSNMVRKDGRKLPRSVVRAMNALSPYKFSVRLGEKCSEHGSVLVRCNEAYTSKTNSFTGEVMNIGSKEWFKHEGVTVNRDINGARNILLRAMRDSSVTC